MQELTRPLEMPTFSVYLLGSLFIIAETNAVFFGLSESQAKSTIETFSALMSAILHSHVLSTEYIYDDDDDQWPLLGISRRSHIYFIIF